MHYKQHYSASGTLVQFPFPQCSCSTFANFCHQHIIRILKYMNATSHKWVLNKILANFIFYIEIEALL